MTTPRARVERIDSSMGVIYRGGAEDAEGRKISLFLRVLCASAVKKGSILPVPRFEMRRLAETFAARHDPRGDPLDERRRADARRTEQLVTFRAVAQQGVRRFDA